MTVSTSTSEATFLGNGVTSVFSFAFIYDTAANLQAIFTDASGNQTTLLTSQYTLNLTAAVPGQIWGIGGTITYPTSGSPIANGTSLTLRRIIPITQTTSISNQGGFYPEVIEAALDIQCMESQQISARTGQFRGTWATGLAYNFGDYVVDGANGANTLNYYMCIVANTSGVWATNLSAGDWTLVINIASINASVTGAAVSAAAASSSASAASASASTASTAATTATTQAGIATTQAGIATTQASNASTSATSASTSATNAASSASNAASAVAAGLASFTGTTNIVTLGTITTGTWNTSGNVTTTGVVTGGSLVPTSNAVGPNGMYLPSANTVGVQAGSSLAAQFTSTGMNSTVIGATTPAAATFTQIVANPTSPFGGINVNLAGTVTNTGNAFEATFASASSGTVNNTQNGLYVLPGTYSGTAIVSGTLSGAQIWPGGITGTNTGAWSAPITGVNIGQLVRSGTGSFSGNFIGVNVQMPNISTSGGAGASGNFIGLDINAPNVTSACNNIVEGIFIDNMGIGGGQAVAYGIFIQRQAGANTTNESIHCVDGFRVRTGSVSGNADIIIGNQALATTATAGFPWIPSGSGAPTGVLTAPYTGAVALYYDLTNNFLYINGGGTWRKSTVYA